MIPPKERATAAAERILRKIDMKGLSNQNRADLIEGALIQLVNNTLDAACDSVWNTYLADHETSTRICMAIRRGRIEVE